jgi:hypothetical protein
MGWGLSVLVELKPHVGCIAIIINELTSFTAG